MNRNEIQRLMQERDKLITGLNNNLEADISTAQRDLLDLFMRSFADKLQTDENGVILNNSYNQNLLVNIDKVFLEFVKNNNVAVINSLIYGVGALVDYNAKYYKNLDGNAKLIPLREKVITNMRGWLGIEANDTAKPNGYLDTLVKSDVVKTQIKNFGMKIIYGRQGFFEAKNELQKMIIGDKDNLGALQKYHRNYTYDFFSQIDRATGLTFAEDLKFEFAIYEGGIIETSRPFCKEHNGNVYHKSEIAKFDPPSAKQPNYNPVTDLGGYGCRHHLNWIPNSLAIMLRPDAEKFIKAA